jgi:hypothetical protein
MKRALPSETAAGVWLDQNKAYIIRLDGNHEPEMKKIKSEVESRVRIPGEGKVFARFGNAFLDDQEKKQRRQQQQRRRYFDSILKELAGVNYLFLFGPGKAKEELKKRMEKKPACAATIVAEETTDRLTKNQMIALTKKFFESDGFYELKKKLRKKKNITD